MYIKHSKLKQRYLESIIHKLESISTTCVMFTVQVKQNNQLFVEFPIKVPL